LSEQATPPSVPLAAIRNDQISFRFGEGGRKLSVKAASAEDFSAWISQALQVKNVLTWSIFLRWHAVNMALEAGTVELTQDEEGMVLCLPAPAIVESTEEVA
jgi:hypothetical protein